MIGGVGVGVGLESGCSGREVGVGELELGVGGFGVGGWGRGGWGVVVGLK